MTTKTIKEIHDAFDKVHRRAMGETRDAYMSIPARPDVDADLIVTSAIDELAALRTQVETLTAERDEAVELLRVVKRRYQCGMFEPVVAPPLGADDLPASIDKLLARVTSDEGHEAARGKP